MRDNDDIHEASHWELCDPVHGACGRGCHDTSDCDGYNKTYDSIKKEWELE